MARTIEDIKNGMTAEWIKQPVVKSAYVLEGKKTFKDCFSAASLENIMFYVFAFAVWSLESLFDMHSQEVEQLIDELEPHTLRWYVAKTKAYMQGHKLVADSDYYDTSGMSATDIEDAKVVKYAVATESNPAKLTDTQLDGLRAYLDEIKDAGVSVQVRNEPADDMRIALVIYYDPTLLSLDGNEAGILADGSEPVREAVQSVITGLPFNGVFRKSDLMAALQALPCVEVADIKSVQVKPHNAKEYETVTGFNRPYSGYYSINSLTVDYQPYKAVE